MNNAPCVLVVEDDPLHSELHCMMLERAGYHTAAVGNAVEALALFTDLSPDLVVTDLRMPGLDGFRFVEILRRDARGARTPVIMISSDALELPPRRGVEAGLFALLPKPVEMVDLLDAAAAALHPPLGTAA
jgi:CheY-like chemotaxis protein